MASKHIRIRPVIEADGDARRVVLSPELGAKLRGERDNHFIPLRVNIRGVDYHIRLYRIEKPTEFYEPDEGEFIIIGWSLTFDGDVLKAFEPEVGKRVLLDMVREDFPPHRKNRIVRK